MLNVGKIEKGIVIDHIDAGKAMLIYHYLGLENTDFTVAIIKNARSEAMGRKDILKIECDVSDINLDVVAFLVPNCTVNIIQDGEIVKKGKLPTPKIVRGVIRCRNPRCISSIEQELPQEFYLADEKRRVYRCRYCDEKYTEGKHDHWFR